MFKFSIGRKGQLVNFLISEWCSNSCKCLNYHSNRKLAHYLIRPQSEQHRILIQNSSSITRTMAVTGESIREVNYETLISKKSEPNVVLIDVREPAEIQETGKLPSSIHIPLGEIETALELSEEEFAKKYNAKKPSKLAEIIFSCKSGRRSLLAMETAIKLGYKMSRSYKGGFTEWQEKNPA